jgi:uncharacterized Zn finger protein
VLAKGSDATCPQCGHELRDEFFTTDLMYGYSLVECWECGWTHRVTPLHRAAPREKYRHKEVA